MAVLIMLWWWRPVRDSCLDHWHTLCHQSLDTTHLVGRNVEAAQCGDQAPEVSAGPSSLTDTCPGSLPVHGDTCGTCGVCDVVRCHVSVLNAEHTGHYWDWDWEIDGAEYRAALVPATVTRLLCLYSRVPAFLQSQFSPQIKKNISYNAFTRQEASTQHQFTVYFLSIPCWWDKYL